MEIVSIDKDGNVVVAMSAAEAKDVKNDLNYIDFTQITRSGSHLFNLLEALYGRRT